MPGAAGVIRECDIHDNEFVDGVTISGGKLHVENCKIRKNGKNGVDVLGGSPVIRECEIFENSLNGLAASGERSALCNPVVERCAIHDNNGRGVIVWNRASGRFSECEIYRNQSYGTLCLLSIRLPDFLSVAASASLFFPSRLLLFIFQPK